MATQQELDHCYDFVMKLTIESAKVFNILFAINNNIEE